MAAVSVVRGAKTLLSKVDWQVREGERWVILGPNGAGKTTLLQIAAARLHPTSGIAGILDESLGKVDVFELRPRIGLSSAALATQIPEYENVLNVVVTAAYGVTGRWREGYEKDDERRAFALLNDWGMGPLLNRKFSTLSEGERKRVQIARARSSCCSTSPPPAWILAAEKTSCTASASWPWTRMRRRSCWSRTTSRKSRRGSPTPCSCATAKWWLPVPSTRCSPRAT